MVHNTKIMQMSNFYKNPQYESSSACIPNPNHSSCMDTSIVFHPVPIHKANSFITPSTNKIINSDRHDKVICP